MSFEERKCLACSPNTYEIASMRLLLPAPFLPTSALWPVEKGSIESCWRKLRKPLILIVFMESVAMLRYLNLRGFAELARGR